MATYELVFVDERPELEITVEETSLVLDTAGIQGPAGPGMTVKGSVEAVEALPTDAEINDGYFIGQEFYVLSEDGWHNAGFVRGAEGEQGPEGPMGPIGPQGETGATGPQGLQGPQGTKGDKGDRGDVGPKGDTGAVGPEGPIGERGPQGLTGPKGDKGDVGPQGQIGPVGPRGSKGDKGDTGATGADSTVPGPEGPRGPMGLQGPQGDKGDTGSQGPVGPQGQTGAEGESAYALAIDNGFVGTEAEWLASLEGPQGPEGEEGATRFIVWDGTAYPARPDADPVTFYGPENPNTLGLMTVGDTWINTAGDATTFYALEEAGLPAGGTAGQVLSKVDATDYNVAWIDAPSGGGSGGGVTWSAWITPSLPNGTFTATHDSPIWRNFAYRYSNDGQVQMRGAVLGTGKNYGLFATSFGTDLPYLRPAARRIPIRVFVAIGDSDDRYEDKWFVHSSGSSNQWLAAQMYGQSEQGRYYIFDGVHYHI